MESVWRDYAKTNIPNRMLHGCRPFAPSHNDYVIL